MTNTREERRALWELIRTTTFRWSIERLHDNGTWRRVRHFRSLNLREHESVATDRFRRAHPESRAWRLRAVRIVPKLPAPHRGSRA